MAIDTSRPQHPLWRFAARTAIAVGIAAVVFLLWKIRHTVLMGVAAVVVAVLVLALADLIRRYAPIAHTWAVTAAVVLIAVLLLGLGLLVGSQVQTQFSELWQTLPQGIQAVEQRLGVPLIAGQQAAGPQGAAAATQAGQDQAAAQQGADQQGTAQQGTDAGDGGVTPVASRLADWVASFGMTVLDAIVGTILVVVAGVFLAAQPDTYRRGATKLFPPSQHRRIGETMTLMGRSLRFWLIGELIAMSIIGVLVGLGTWAIGLPAPLALGLFAGLAEFVPIVGPIVGAIPALLVALSEGGSAVLWTLLLFIVVQQLESNVIAPLVQERMVLIPPALFLLAVAAFGALFGILGVILAAPLTVLVYVAVQKLWVRDALDEGVHITGEDAR